MPPRIPVVAVFLAIYFAVILGGGVEALSWSVSFQLWSGLGGGAPTMTLSLAEAIAAAAGLVCVPDAALRRARAASDKAVSMLVAALAVGVAVARPEVATLGYGALTALALGDMIAALGTAPPRSVVS